MLGIMSYTPTACMILIGNELLSGRTQDKNLFWLAPKLNELGIHMAHARVIPDVTEIIVATINTCRMEYDYVFTTGGIGPTHDDITAAAIARAFGVPLKRHAEAERRLCAHYRPEDLNEARLKMADIPEGAALIDNPLSAAPGFVIENVFVLAGVPAIMQAMFEHFKTMLRGGRTTHSLTIETDLPEGAIAAGLTAIQQRFPKVDIGCYPVFLNGELSSTVVLRSQEGEMLNAAANEVETLLVHLT